MHNISRFLLLLSLTTLGLTASARPLMIPKPLSDTTIVDNEEDDVLDEDDLGRRRTVRIPQRTTAARSTTSTSPTRLVADENIVPPAAAKVDPTVGMLHNVDGLLNAWYVKEYMTLDPSTPDGENPIFPAEVYMDRLRRLPTVIEMPYNDIVQGYIDQYTGRLRRSVSFMLGAQNFYIPIFEQALEAEGLPLELKYLPIVESALDPTAVSRVGATGLWQFMIATAKRYDLTVNTLVDERRDPIKASAAAAQCLKDLHRSFGDWALALAAYNCGATNVRKAIRRAGGVADYWKIYPYLPKETRGYVPAFIAVNYVMNYYCAHNIPAMTTTVPIETDTLMLNRDVHLRQISEVCNLSYDILEAMNPQYRTGLIPGYSSPCALRLPSQTVDYFLQLGDSVYNYRTETYLSKRSVVEAASDRTEARSVRRNRRGAEAVPAEPSVVDAAPEPKPVAAASPQRDAVPREQPAETDAAGQTARREVVKAEPSKRSVREQQRVSTKKRKKRKPAEPTEVSVKKGDTLEEIAKRNGTTVEKLRKNNKIKGDMIKPGEKLRLK